MNAVHGKVTGLQEALEEAGRQGTSAERANSLVENTHRSLRPVIHSIDDGRRPVLVRLLMGALDALPESDTRPDEANLASAIDFLKQAHALIHDEDPHPPGRGEGTTP